MAIEEMHLHIKMYSTRNREIFRLKILVFRKCTELKFLTSMVQVKITEKLKIFSSTLKQIEMNKINLDNKCSHIHSRLMPYDLAQIHLNLALPNNDSNQRKGQK